MSKPIRNAAQTAALITLAAALLAGCAVTEQRPVTEAKNCAFLGPGLWQTDPRSQGASLAALCQSRCEVEPI